MYILLISPDESPTNDWDVEVHPSHDDAYAAVRQKNLKTNWRIVDVAYLAEVLHEHHNRYATTTPI